MLKTKLLEETGSVGTPLVLTLVIFVLALFMAVAVAIPAFAAQQAQSVTDEMQQTTNFVAAFARDNLAGSTVQQGYLQSVADSTAATLLNRPLQGSVLGDEQGSVGGAYVTKVSLDSVQSLAPGDPVPGMGGIAKSQGAAVTFTMQVDMLGSLVPESTTKTVWAFPGNP